MERRPPEWLKKAVFYEIYPQSFYDTNGDGIGDIEGIIQKLDYISRLGCNALWINPWYDSPFKDAGYDVRDYKKIAPRYGTNEDAYRLFDEAHKKGIRVLIDLVPGHTSEEHEWFKASGKAEKNEYSERYIWTDFWIKGIPDRPYIGGECERNGVYMLNFFKCQPALNYGWKDPKENWMHGIDSPEAIATREAIKDVMRFWLSKGCDGFRVDMADSLVKGDDDEKSATCAVWKDLFEIRDEFPDAAFVSEWSCPRQAIAGAGFDMDFYLDHGGNGYNTLMRDFEIGGDDESYFKKDSGGNIKRFLDDFIPGYEAAKGKGYISFITCNHDTCRPSYNLDKTELKLAYAFLITMPGVPFIYYGDEIGMRYIADQPTKEGGYTRTGSRTPMQWERNDNLGFSDASKDKLYLPVDTDPAAPVADEEMEDPDSLYNTVRELLNLKRMDDSLDADADFEVLYSSEDADAFIYRRGGYLIAINPYGKEFEHTLKIRISKKLFEIGNVLACDNDGKGKEFVITSGEQSFAVFELKG